MGNVEGPDWRAIERSAGRAQGCLTAALWLYVIGALLVVGVLVFVFVVLLSAIN